MIAPYHDKIATLTIGAVDLQFKMGFNWKEKLIFKKSAKLIIINNRMNNSLVFSLYTSNKYGRIRANKNLSWAPSSWASHLKFSLLRRHVDGINLRVLEVEAGEGGHILAVSSTILRRSYIGWSFYDKLIYMQNSAYPTFLFYPSVRLKVRPI